MSYIGNSPGVASSRVTTTLTATAGQTVFTTQSGYVLGYVDVYLNGVKLVNGADFEAITGTYITLFAGALVGDVVELVSYVPRGLTDGYTKSEADAKFLDVGGDTASGTINLGTNGLVVGTNQLVASGGKIGVGTASPTETLTVVGNIKAGYEPATGIVVGLANSIPNNNVNAYLLWGADSVFGGVNGDLIYIPRSSATASHRFYTGTAGLASEKVRISNAGDLGIGTTSPWAKLSIAASNGQFGIANGNTAGGMKLQAWNAAGNNDGYLAFEGYTKEYARFDSSGNFITGGNVAASSVGGITATSGNAGGVSVPIVMRNPGTANGSGVLLSFRGSTNSGAENDYAYLIMVADNTTTKTGSIRFATSSGSSPAERARITSTGFFGIGTDLPASRLSVNTTSYAAVTNGEQVLIENTSAWTQGLAFSIWGAGIYGSGYPSGYIGAPNTLNELFISGGAVVVNNPGQALWAKSLNTTSASFTVVGAGATTFYGDTGLTANTVYTPTQRARIDSSGRMQLGTTSMSDGNGSRLTVAATFPMTPLEIRSDSTSGHYAAVFYNPFGLIGQIQTNGNDFVIGGAGVNQNVLFTQGNGTVRMRLDSSGRLLLGSQTVAGGLGSETLQVGSGFSGITNTGSNTTPTIVTSGSLEFNFDGVSGTQRHGRITGTAGNGAGSAYGGGLSFEYYSYDGSSTYQWYTGFALDGAGRLGIGTTSPAAKLDIKMSGDGDIFVGRHHASTAKLVYAYQSGSDGFLELRTGADQIVTKLSGYAGTASYFKSNVGIGTTAPAVALEVRDRARFGDGTNTLTIGYWDSANNRIESVNKPLLLTTYSGDIVMGISGGTTAIVTSTSLNVNGSIVPNYLSVGSLVSNAINGVPQGITRYTFSIPADNVWRTLVSNFNDHSGEFILTISDTSSGDVATYVARTTSPAYGVANMVQTYYMEGGWNTGAFEVQFLNIGGTYALQVRYTSYYSSGNVGGGSIQFTRF